MKLFSKFAVIAGICAAATTAQAQILSLDFNEGSGTTVTDSASGKSGVFGFAFDPQEANYPTWVGGVSGAPDDYALLFDGDDIVMIDDPDGTYQLNEAGAFTFEAHILVSTPVLDGRKIIYSYGLPGGYSFSVDADFSAFNTTYGIADIDSETAIIPNDVKWHHVAAIYDGSVISYYIDGELSATVDYTSGINATETAQRFLVGLESVNFDGRIINGFIGAIDNVQVYAEAIDPSALLSATVTAVSSTDNWELAK